MTPLRSAGWSVRPSFVPHGATAPVTLLMDDDALTQLAGDPAVAWQTPWSELSNVQARGVRARHGAVRDRGRRPVLLAQPQSRGPRGAARARRGARGNGRAPSTPGRGLQRRGRRAARGARGRHRLVALRPVLDGVERELQDARHVNLTLKDLPTGWYLASALEASPLAELFRRRARSRRYRPSPRRRRSRAPC